eukprot:SAG25_NODE_3395_length_1097_cov_1.650301_1_plen_204_part_00
MLIAAIEDGEREEEDDDALFFDCVSLPTPDADTSAAIQGLRGIVTPEEIWGADGDVLTARRHLRVAIAQAHEQEDALAQRRHAAAAKAATATAAAAAAAAAAIVATAAAAAATAAAEVAAAAAAAAAAAEEELEVEQEQGLELQLEQEWGLELELERGLELAELGERRPSPILDRIDRARVEVQSWHSAGTRHATVATELPHS